MEGSYFIHFHITSYMRRSDIHPFLFLSKSYTYIVKCNFDEVHPAVKLMQKIKLEASVIY